MGRLPHTGREPEYETGLMGIPWLGPVGFIGGMSPYLDWFLETFYYHYNNWVN